jgi:hypothetical protein
MPTFHRGEVWVALDDVREPFIVNNAFYDSPNGRTETFELIDLLPRLRASAYLCVPPEPEEWPQIDARLEALAETRRHCIVRNRKLGRLVEITREGTALFGTVAIGTLIFPKVPMAEIDLVPKSVL